VPRIVPDRASESADYHCTLRRSRSSTAAPAA